MVCGRIGSGVVVFVIGCCVGFVVGVLVWWWYWVVVVVVGCCVGR